MSSFYILENRPLSEVSLANVSPYSWFSFHFYAVFFSHAEAFYFDEIPFVYSFLYVPCSRAGVSNSFLLGATSASHLPSKG